MNARSSSLSRRQLLGAAGAAVVGSTALHGALGAEESVSASGGRLNWDGHNALKEQYDVHAKILDQPAAALIRDLQQRGLLKDTLVVWCTEFGRMPFFQKGAQGRDHNPDGFTCWMTGAGVKPGVSHGQTDELGRAAMQDVHPLYDLNATILHLLGLDHERLTFEHNGIQRRLTNVEGHVIREVLA